MKDDAFKIFVKRLRDGKVQTIEQTVSPDFLDVDTSELSFKEKVLIKGECYFADDALVLHLDIITRARTPCSICNEPVAVTLDIQGLYHLEPLENMKRGIFDMQEVVRESVLLEVPAFAECNDGNCSKRKAIAKYMKPSNLKDNSSSNDEGYQPFRDLHVKK